MGTVILHGITLCSQVVNALLYEGKPEITAFRLVKFKYYHCYGISDAKGLACSGDACWLTNREGLTITQKLKTRFNANDTVYVRETWKEYEKAVGVGEQFRIAKFFAYKADTNRPEVQKTCEWYDGQWRPPQHMPKSAARIFLRVAGTSRIVRLHDLDYVDYLTSGIDTDIFVTEWSSWNHCRHMDKHQIANEIYRKRFKALWDSENGKKNGGACSWDNNPYVEAVRLELTEAPSIWSPEA